MDDSLRKESERQFHNQRYAEDQADIRDPLNKWYAAVASGARKQNELVRRYGKGAHVLEYGCADGRISLVYDHLADGTASFTGIDISDQAIEVARKSAASAGLVNCTFSVMDAEKMNFPDASFDLVFGRGILHHLDLGKCFPEIARVLRPGGRADFTEPLGHNPAINLYRKMTPDMRTPDEHPLLMSDLRAARTYFSKVDCEFFGLMTLFAVPLHKKSIGPRLMKVCEHADSLLLRFPLLRRNAWSVLFTLTK